MAGDRWPEPVKTFFKYYLPVLLWAALVAWFSSDAFSGNMTLRLLRGLNDWLHLELSRSTLLELNIVVRKLAHISEYFIFALLTWRAVRQERTGQWKQEAAWWTVAVSVGLAAADESLQMLRQLRTGSVADVGIDSVGVVLALGLVWWRTREAAPARQH